MGRGQILCQTNYSHHLKTYQLEIKCHYKETCLVKNLSKETFSERDAQTQRTEILFSFKNKLEKEA